jgi:outer membrane biosynthesis protein TonB
VTREKDGVWRALGYQLNFASAVESQPSPAAAVQKVSPAVKGSLGTAIVTRTVRNHFGEAKSCYDKALLRRPELANRPARLDVHFTVANSGKVSSIVVEENTLGDRDLETCVLERIATWSFPKTIRGDTRVVYPFVLR